jgi:ATP-dependent protease ClpP protease subunit
MEQLNNKPLLLFAPIYDYVAEELIDKMNEIPENQDIEIWANSPGGRVFAGWTIIGAMQKRTGKCKMSIFGHAASMMIFLTLFADEVEALEVSQFMIHRADGYVKTPEDQAFLDKINKDLRKQMESRLNMEKFEEVTGKTMDQIFDPKQRIDVWIDAKQAKKIGLIQKIKKLTPQQIKAYNEKFVAFADFDFEGQRSPEDDTQRSVTVYETTNINNNNKRMTKAELLAQHPEIVEAIKKEAVEAERERVNAFMAFIDVDKENVIKSIKEGQAFNNAVMAELTVKMSAKSLADKIKDDSTGETPTGKANDKTAEQKEIEDFQKQVDEKTKKII